MGEKLKGNNCYSRGWFSTIYTCKVFNIPQCFQVVEEETSLKADHQLYCRSGPRTRKKERKREKEREREREGGRERERGREGGREGGREEGRQAGRIEKEGSVNNMHFKSVTK